MIHAYGKSAEPLTRIVHATSSTPADDRALHAANDADGGVLVVPVSPMVQGIGRLAGDVLTALGKDSRIAPYGRRRDAEITWAHDWLVGHRIRRLVFAHCDDLDPEIVTEAQSLAASAGAEPWFVFRTDRGAVKTAALFATTIDTKPAADLCNLIGLGPALSGPARASRPLRVPDLAPRTMDADRTAAIRLVRATFEEAPAASADELVVTAGAALGRQWQLGVLDANRFQHPYSLLPIRSIREFSWSSLRRGRDTAQVAACVLAAMKVSVREALALRASNVADDGAEVAVVRDVLPVPEVLRIYLRARLATVRRLRLGTDPVLLADRRTPTMPRALRTMVCAGFDELGVIFPPSEMEYRISPEERWLDRHGLELVRLFKPLPKPVLFTRPGRSTPSCTYRTVHRRFYGGRRSER